MSQETAPVRFDRDESGQTVVIVALMFTLMLGFAALSLDVGRFYAERRYLQGAADAAALACVRAYSQADGTSAKAWAAADTILQNYNLRADPLGLTVTYPAQNSEEYYDNVVEQHELKSGILPQTSPRGCRVALYVDVPTVLIKVVNPTLSTIGLNARAYAAAKGGLVPVVVPKYTNGPGPGASDGSTFVHHTMAEGDDYQCTVSSDAGCSEASTTDKGREFVLFGASQPATGGAPGYNSFRGYIALDVRDFQTTDGSGNLVHTSYNEVAADASINTLKDFEANWIREGYPGPELCTVSSTDFLACAEVAVINGASAGIFVPVVEDRYAIGDHILAQLYDGTVKTIPNFTINYPSLVISSGTGTVAAQSVSFTFSSQYEDSGGQVTTTFYPDDGSVTEGASCATCGDTLNPWHPSTTCVCTATSGTLATNPTPANQSSYSQTWSGITLTAAPKGIYVVFLKGVSGAPYAGTSQTNIVTVNINDQKKQFYISSSDVYQNVASVGTTATYNINVVNGTGLTQFGSGTVNLKVDQCPKNGSTTLTCSFGSSGGQTATTSAGGTDTLVVQTTGGTAGKTYTGWLRAYGDSSTGKVTRVLQFQTAINVTAGGTTDYVDVLGYAVFEVTYIDSNDVKGKAVSGAKLSLDDAALAIAQKYRLIPWEED